MNLNRSIFQIWKFKIISLIYSLIFSVFVLFFINFDFYLNCFSIKGLNNNFLKEINYNNKIFNYSKEISEIKVKNSLDFFYNNYNRHNVRFSLCKYFEILDNKIVLFDKQSCYSHPNLFFGVYNDLYFNFQFSHFNINNNFDYFSKIDIKNINKPQFICNRIYIYNNNLFQQFLNYEDLKNNNYSPFNNNYCHESQSYVYNHKNKFKVLINNIIV